MTISATISTSRTGSSAMPVEPDLRRVGGALACFGYLGIAVLSLLYAAAPPNAAVPAQPLDLAAALTGTIEGAGFMRAAGLIGMAADSIAIMGTLLIMLETARRGSATAAAGWGGIALAVAIFIPVDILVGSVLPPLAEAGAVESFGGFKRLFDALFLTGTLTFGLGAILAMGAELLWPRLGLSRLASGLGLVFGIVGLVSASACLAGLPFHLGVGAAIGLGAVAFAWIGATIARH